MVQPENLESVSNTPEMGDYSFEERELRRDLEQERKMQELANQLEKEAAFNPIEALKSFIHRLANLL